MEEVGNSYSSNSIDTGLTGCGGSVRAILAAPVILAGLLGKNV